MIKNSKFFVTTSIAYANSKPHIGYAMELIQADVLARYYTSKNYDTFFLTGTDEHGQKLHEAAKENKRSPQEYVDELSQTFRDLAKKLELKHNYFIRTTDERHKQAAQKIWQACQADIYKGNYSGLYCVGCERFYKEDEAVDGKCPIHRTTLRQTEMESYFFRQTKYADKITELIKMGELRVLPEKRKNETLAFLRNLEDISISRPKSQLEWGVEVPGDASHVMYVWFDALSNYISAIGYGDDETNFAKWWPADVHIVGKDIARFHTILWPAMLLSAGLGLPRTIYVHGFIESGGHKMSKSLGNVIDPQEVIKKYGIEPMRYYLLRYIPSDNDGDFTFERLEAVYNADLANDLGNLVQRTASMLGRYNDGKFDATKVKPIEGVEEQLEELAYDRALETIFERVREQNVFLEEKQPWTLAKTDKAAVVKVLSQVASQLQQIAGYLEPFLPDTSDKIGQTFAGGKVDVSVGILFPRIEDK